MIYKNFKVNVVLRVLLICIFIGLLMYFLLVDERYLRSVYLAVFLILSVLELFWYIDKSNRDFSSFLLALLQNDFSTTFSGKSKGRSFARLYDAYNQITQKFKDINADKELQHQYLLMLIKHINIGIISFDEKGHVLLINNAFKEIVDKPFINNIKVLERVSPVLYHAINDIQPGRQQLVKLALHHKIKEFAVEASEFKVGSSAYKLVSLQNIAHQLDENETMAWQKLIRVLTHEIMNSVTPITSLTDTLHHIVRQKLEKNEVIDALTLEKVNNGLMVINDRSKGLVNFTEAYKNLTRIPAPAFKKVSVSNLQQQLSLLFKPKLAESNINFEVTEVDTTPEILADPELLSQVLINLLKNAMEAVANQKNPLISISTQSHGEKSVVIKVRDNGPGIPPEILENIFIPFFTTKEGGSGIGLSVCRQIIQLHKGVLTVDTKPGVGTVFTIMI
ncbi:ATP-binding protein [Fulvivirgaceae bacterium BMA12]|uniref:histidine kinase n=1 Tax=Agaribacillus aureus TaxID=3051825 RepID=A0ABT8L045_9BACT|nr:ATP-binding protein [Fulvivirgaceae bacterium BMA12]